MQSKKNIKDIPILSNMRLNRKIHFLGTKIRSLRKLNGLTLEDMVVRCMKIDNSNSPSVSYLSLIETGRRNPSKNILMLMKI